MSKTPNYDAKIKTILDTAQPGERVCALTGEKWNMTEEEIGWYKKFNVPPSPLSLLTRMKILTSFVVGIDIWWNKHPETGKPILSYIHPDSPLKPMPDPEWFICDFSTEQSELRPAHPFLPQVTGLIKEIPTLALRQFILPKNTIGTVTLEAEDSYMVTIFRGKRSYYVYQGFDVEDSIDIAYSRQINRCYSLLRCFRMHHCDYAFESSDCMNSRFLFDCRNCESCFGATNMRNKKYIWMNEQLSKEEYERRYAEVDLGSRLIFDMWKERFHALIQEQSVWPENFNIQCEQSSGEYLRQCTRVKNGFWLDKVIDSFYFWFGTDGGSDVALTAGARNPSQLYMVNGAVDCANTKFSAIVSRCDDIEYSFGCFNCTHCFGCVGLREKTYCILNKQYTEETYWPAVDAIKCAMVDLGEYGSFFPVDVSPGGFVFSPTMWFFDMNERDLEMLHAPQLDPKRGNMIRVNELSEAMLHEVSEIPDDIDDVDPSVLVQKAIRDPELDRNFSVIEPEFALYRERHLPFPRRHHTARLKALVSFADKPLTEECECASCHVRIQASKNSAFPDRRVYCSSCYLKYLETR